MIFQHNYRVIHQVSDPGWVVFYFDVPFIMPWLIARSARLSSAQAKSGRQWNSQNHSQPNSGPQPDESPCTNTNTYLRTSQDRKMTSSAVFIRNQLLSMHLSQRYTYLISETLILVGSFENTSASCALRFGFFAPPCTFRMWFFTECPSEKTWSQIGHL